MSKLVWGGTGKRYYELGVTRGVLYVQDTTNDSVTYKAGVAWDGIISVSESPDGAEPNDLYADDGKYAILRSAETFGATIEAYTYPEEFAECDGTKEAVAGVFIGQQARSPFGLCYRTAVGSDTDPSHQAYKLHLVYNCTASPSDKSYETINDSPDAITFSWEISTNPVDVAGYSKFSTIVIDSRKANAAKLAALEKKLYGDTDTEPTMPSPAEVMTMMAATSGT